MAPTFLVGETLVFCIKRIVGLSTVLLSLILISPAGAQNADRIKRGEYLFHAGGCAGCHTDVKNKGAILAGGRPLKTPFGIYFGPNITPDQIHGIGKWRDNDFIRALRKGVSPDGGHYFPVFPYTSFTKMTDRDMLDLKAYIFTLPAVAKANIPHDINFPYGFRFSMTFWKLMFFDEGPFKSDAGQSKQLNRGAYLVKALLHCGECHTPRNRAGAVISDRELAGTPDGPEGNLAPNITPHPKTGIGKWSEAEIIDLLDGGMLPDGDFVGGAMSDVVDGASKLSKADRSAIAKYLKSLPPIDNKVVAKPNPPKKK